MPMLRMRYYMRVESILSFHCAITLLLRLEFHPSRLRNDAHACARALSQAPFLFSLLCPWRF